MNQVTNHNIDYLDYYSEWLLAFKNADTFGDLKVVLNKAERFIGILNELLDADKIGSELAASYITEVNKYNQNLIGKFFN